MTEGIYRKSVKSKRKTNLRNESLFLAEGMSWQVGSWAQAKESLKQQDRLTGPKSKRWWLSLFQAISGRRPRKDFPLFHSVCRLATPSPPARFPQRAGGLSLVVTGLNYPALAQACCQPTLFPLLLASYLLLSAFLFPCCHHPKDNDRASLIPSPVPNTQVLYFSTFDIHSHQRISQRVSPILEGIFVPGILFLNTLWAFWQNYVSHCLHHWTASGTNLLTKVSFCWHCPRCPA